MDNVNQPTLYGIYNSNRSPNEFWGKNNFNSSFPVSLACYMRDNNINPVYLKLDENLQVVQSEISIDDVFNCGNTPTKDLFFGFEMKYDPYQVYSYSQIDHIDLIVKNNSTGEFLRPLEVKMTVLPDNSTYRLRPSLWGSEIVIRPDTTIYCALGIADACQYDIQKIRDLFEPICHNIESWGNNTEMVIKFPQILNLLNEFEKQYFHTQKPLILQPIWKTKGKNPDLDDYAFDMFVWSDFAFTRLFLDYSQFNNNNITSAQISRQMRSALRLTRCMYEISKSKKVNLDTIYKQMTFNWQTDKEFSANGRITNRYMSGQRLNKPVLPKDIVEEIILNGGEKLLSPERRFDQTIYFTMVRTKEI